MSTPVKHAVTIIQGTTQHVPFVRRYIDFEVKESQGEFVDAATGEVVDPTRFVDEDYTGCQARMQLREDIDSSEVLWEMTTDNGRITLQGNTLTLVFLPDESAQFTFANAIGHIEVVRPSGSIERQYEIKFKVSREGTR